MERLMLKNPIVKRAVALAALFLLFGGVLALSTRKDYDAKTEQWMEEKAPLRFDGYTMLPSADNPMQSYRMNESTYRALAPFGIVSRVYMQGNDLYDVVLIASQSKDSFHDPRICFGSQGWELVDLETAQVQTKNRGTVPVTVARMDGPQKDQLTVFFYRGPDGFHAATWRVKLGMFLEQLKGGRNIDGVFYRIIPNHSGATRDDLLVFTAEYLDAAYETSGGYF